MNHSLKYVFTGLLIVLVQQSMAQTRSARSNQTIARSNAPVEKKGNVYALIVGVGQYKEEKLNKLNYPVADALSFYNFLKTSYTLKNVDTNNIRLDTNATATLKKVSGDLIVWLGELRPKVKPGDELFIYWSGHGMVDNVDQKLLCTDVTIESMDELDLDVAINMQWAKDRVMEYSKKEDVRAFLIVDACREYLIRESKVIPYYPALSAPKFKRESLLYACAMNSQSYECKDLGTGSGVFTYFLLLSLQGAADIIKEDGIITQQEMTSFLNSTVNRYVASKALSPNPENIKQQWPEIRTGEVESKIVLNQVTAEQVKASKKKVHDLFTGLNVQSPYTLIPKGIHSERGVRDTTWKDMYDMALRAIDSGRLVRPGGTCAFDLYRALVARYPDSAGNASLKYSLFVALLDGTKKLIDGYVAGKTTDLPVSAFEEGYQVLNAAFQLVPGDTSFRKSMKPQLSFLRARTLAGSNDPSDWNEGLDFINEALGTTSKNAYLYHCKALLYANKNRYYTALEYLDSARKKAPGWNYLMYDMAAIYHKIQEFDSSMFWCNRLIQAWPSYARGYSCLASNWESIIDFSDLKDYNEAIDWNLRSLKQDSSNVNAWYNLGNIYRKHRGGPRAYRNVSLKYFRQGAIRNDDNSLTMLGKMKMEEMPPSPDSAAYFFTRALSINPYNSYAIGEYARMLSPNSADSLFQSRLRKTDRDYKINIAYKNYLFQARSVLQAETLFRDIVLRSHEDPLVFVEHARMLEQIDSILMAKNTLHLGLYYIPRNPALTYAVAQLYFNHSRHPQFLAYAADSSFYYLDLLRTYAPQYSMSYYNMYQLLLSQGKLQDAYSFLMEARKRNKYAGTTLNLGRDLERLGDSALSKMKYTDALRYYELAALALEEKNIIWIKTMRTYYLKDELDSADLYYDRIINSYKNRPLTGMDTLFLVKVDQVKGLVEIEKGKNKSVKKAIVLFTVLDGTYIDYPHFMEQAVCYYILKDKNVAKNMALSRPEFGVEAFNKMLKAEGTEYSPYFIQKLKDLVAEIDPAISPFKNFQ